MKDTFDKVNIDKARQQEIRAGLMGKRRARKTWIAPIAAVAAAIAVIMIVPYTREIVVNAAADLYMTFMAKHNNLEYTVEESVVTDSEGSDIYHVSTVMNFSEMVPYGQVKDGKLYFVLDGKSEDVTDKCSDIHYYRYEEKQDNGYKCIFFVGGTPDDFGWGQIILNDKDEFISGFVAVDTEDYDAGWLRDVICKENVIDRECLTFVSKDELQPFWAIKWWKEHPDGT